jgi:hypothetical protein
MPFLLLTGTGPRPNWMDPIVPGTDLQDRALWNMLLAAANERALALWTSNASNVDVDATFAAPYTPWAAGADLSDWHAIPPLQTFLVNNIGNFLNHTLAASWPGTAYTTDPFAGANWTLASARAAAGLPTTKVYSYSSGADPVYAGAGADNSVLRRRRYRQIDRPTATRDVWGNPAVAGQRAFFTGAALSGDTGVDADRNHIWLGTAYSGTRWRCVASGNWVRDDSAQADILDNTLGPPNCITQDGGSCYLGDPPARESGELQPGDIIEPAVAEEIRRLIDLMRWTLARMGSYSGANAGTSGKDYFHVTPQDGGAHSVDECKALAEAAWPGLPDDGGGTYECLAALGADHVPFTLATYNVQVTRFHYVARTMSYTTALARKLRVYAASDDPDASAHVEYDSQATGLVRQRCALLSTTGPVANRNEKMEIGDPALPFPAWPSHVVTIDPGSTFHDSDSASRGCTAVTPLNAGRPQMVMLWNVSGGFQYCTAQD